MPRPRRAYAEPDWLPVGEEPQPLGNITHCVVLRHAGISCLSLHSADIDADEEPGNGLYLRDTRHLSLLRLTFGGVAPVLLDASSETSQSAIFTNPAIRSPVRDEVIPAQTLVVRRRRVIAGCLAESLSVSNYGQGVAMFELRFEYAADFRDIFEIRGYERTSPRSAVEASIQGRRVHWKYTGTDQVTRETTLAFHQQPSALSDSEASFNLTLGPGDTQEIRFEVVLNGEHPRDTVEEGVARVHAQQRQWLGEATQVSTNHEPLNAMLRRSLLDIHALQTTFEGDRYLAAGVPWYDTLFGRDSLIAGIELLAFAPSILKNALLELAKYQADSVDVRRDATPGKIPHELRWGELAQAGEVVFGRYYGSVDATPLFIYAAAEYVRWTGDRDTLRELWPHLQRAMAWCREEMAVGVDGFVAYSRRSSGGLENQGWKDSHDAIVWPDGQLVESPIALIEVQGYVAAALSRFSQLEVAMGDSASAGNIAGDAEEFAQRMHLRYGDDELGYVLCLDGKGRTVPTPASNPGHVLWTGAARRDLARRVATRLLEPDLFTGWGVRTLGSGVAGYNPLGYHVGSVWPHDNALLLAGLRWYGFDSEAERLGSALIEMSLAFRDYRVPELFSGDARSLRSVPTPYPVASRPQAWSAASIPYALTALLGLNPGRQGQLYVARPMLPPEIDHLRVRNLCFAGGSADLSFRRTGRHVSVEIERLEGGIEVVLSDSPPSELLPGATR